jgi:hypothetical protein
VQIVEEHLSALRALQKIARQPIALEVMRLVVQEHFGGNGHAVRATPTERAVERRGAIWVTGIKEAVEKVIPTLRGEFTYLDIIDGLGKNDYQIAAKNRRTAVGRVLLKLVDKKTILLVQKGIASNASVYRLA